MKIEKVNEREMNVIVEDKGWFNVMFEDWGGEYPGIDIEWHWDGATERCAPLPRVMFEIEDGSENPCIRVWADPNSEDSTNRFDFNKEDYVCTGI